MLTLKQLEAVYWVANLGTFAAAADHLCTTQSAISKRIYELETYLSVPLFDRGRRAPRLTPKGREFCDVAEEMLKLRDCLLERMGKEVAMVRQFRLGITELIALTFLPTLVRDIRTAYPSISIEPEIDVSTKLISRLMNGDVDFIISPSAVTAPGFTSVPLKKLQLAWMASPDLLGSMDPMSLNDIATYPILMQTGTSGVDAIYTRWFESKGVQIRRVFTGNSLIALCSLTIAGFGVSYLPALYFSDLVDKGQLIVVPTTQRLPSVRYYATYRDEAAQPVSAFVSTLAQKNCDFSRANPISVIQSPSGRDLLPAFSTVTV